MQKNRLIHTALALTAAAALFSGHASAADNFHADSSPADTTIFDSIDEVVVTGTNNAVSRKLLPYTVSTVSSSEIAATGQSQLLGALSGQVPGLFISQRSIFGFGISNGGSGGIKIRGVGGSPTNAVLMMVDGQPQFAGIYSHHVADFYDSEYVERVEVLRGPASVLYGRFSSLVSASYGRTDGTVENFDFRQASVYAKLGYDFSEDPRYFHSLDDRFGVLAYQNLDLWGGAAATIGFDFNTYSGEIPVSGGTEHHEGSMSTISRKSITEYSPYLTFAQEFFDGRLTVNGGLRMANSDMFDTQWIPQAGIIGHPGAGWTLKASVAKGYRNPSFRELYLYRPANPDLEPESMVNYEATVGKSFSHWFSIDVTGYWSRGSNLIQTAPDPASGQQLNQNTGSFTNRGIEVSATSNPLDKLSLQASYSYLHTSLTDLTEAPTHQYFLGAGWQALPRLRIDAQLQGVAGLFVHRSLPREDYALLNLKLSYDVLDWMQLFADLDNLTDTRYTIVYGYPMPGFTALGGFRLHF